MCCAAGQGARERSATLAALGGERIMRLPPGANSTLFFLGEPVESCDLPNIAAGDQLQLLRFRAAVPPCRPDHQVLDARSLAVGRDGSGGRNIFYSFASIELKNIISIGLKPNLCSKA